MITALTLLAKKESNIAAVAHDAGAANIIIATLLESGVKQCRALMRGPSEKLWQAAFPAVPLCEDLEATINGAELLITGTSWGSNLEHDARKLAKFLEVKSITILDHWVNYAERFIKEGEQVLPDEFWVTDDYAYGILRCTFPFRPIFQFPNYYLKKQLHKISLVKKPEIPELLYILEPMQSNWGLDKPGEFQALDLFMQSRGTMQLPQNYIINLRPHPSEKMGKYLEWISSHNEVKIQIDETIDIADSIGRATWVVGCESFGLVLALLAGHAVFCSLPEWAPSCRLPYKNLIHLSKLA